jgi:hypothetical protein
MEMLLIDILLRATVDYDVRSSLMSHDTPIVLVVDDDISVRESLELLIRDAGPQAWLAAIALIAAPHPHTSSRAKLSTADIARELL